MKFADIRPCDLCDQPVSGKTRDGNNALEFYRIVVERQILNVGALREHVGLSMMMGGNERMARAFASHDEISHPFERMETLVCFPCMLECLADLMQTRGKRLPIVTEEQQP